VRASQNTRLGKICCPTGETVFIHCAQSLTAYRESSCVYDETASGQTYYNYYRDYDSASGRFVESDPVGLKAGPNTYAYVSGDPVNNVDPTGLLQQCRTGLDKLGGFGSSTPVHHEYQCWTNADGTTTCRGFGRDPDSSIVDAILKKVPGKILKDDENISHGKQSCEPDDKNKCMDKCADDEWKNVGNNLPAYSWNKSNGTQCQAVQQSIYQTCQKKCNVQAPPDPPIFNWGY